MMNSVLRNDSPRPLMQTCCRIVRTMREVCPVFAPSQGVSYRGCTMSSAGVSFFIPGLKFRSPCFLSTCIDREAAARHCSYNVSLNIAEPVPVLWHIQCSRKNSNSLFSACLPFRASASPAATTSLRAPLLRCSGTPSRVSPARVSSLYSSSRQATFSGIGSVNDISLDIPLEEEAAGVEEVCHSALWLQGSDVFLYVPYSVFIVVSVSRPAAVGGLVQVNRTPKV
jgi:hypothetical protein